MKIALPNRYCARGLEYGPVLETSGTVFPHTDRPRLVNNIYILLKYLKIPIISPGLIFVQKAVLLGLFLGKFIFGGAYYWR